MKKQRKKRLFSRIMASVLVVLAVGGTLLPVDSVEFITPITAEAYDAGYYVVTAVKGLTIRSEPSTTSSNRGASPQNVCFYVSQTSGDWGYTDCVYAWANNAWVQTSGWMKLSENAVQVDVDDELGVCFPRPTGDPLIAQNTDAANNYGYVSWIQAALNKTIGAGLNVDGRFGDSTTAKVREFQSRYGLTADGYVGTSTVSKMVEVLNSLVVSPSAPVLNVSAGNDQTNTVLKWNVCSNADWYDIYIYDSNGNHVSGYPIYSYGGTSYAVTLPAGSYSADIASVNSNGNYTFSGRVYFDVAKVTTTTTTTTTKKTTTTTTTTKKTTTTTTTTTAKTTTTTSTTKPAETTTTTRTAIGNQIIHGVDDYSFLNNKNYFHADAYRISDKHKDYFSKVNNKSWEKIRYRTEKSNDESEDIWNGSCYGLACVEILVKMGEIAAEEIQADASCLHDLDVPKDNADVESIINFYQLQQYTTIGENNLTLMLSYMSNKQRVDKVISAAEEAQNGGVPSLLVFDYSKNKSQKIRVAGRHAVVAYGIEYGEWTIEASGNTYNCRILISDSNVDGFQDDNCMYIDTENYYWEIPYYDKNGMGLCTNKNKNEYAQIVYITNDLAFIDQMSYSEDKNTESISKISIDTADTAFNVSYYSDDPDSSVNSSDDFELIYYGGSAADAEENIYGETVNALLPTADVAYEYDTKDITAFKTAVDYTESRMTADVSNGSYAIYQPNESVEFVGEDSDYTLSMILNEGYYSTDWYKIEVTGENAAEAKISVSDAGYILSSDSLADGVLITASNREVTANLGVMTKYDSVLIYEIDETHIGIKLDTDGDGVYETKYTPTYIGDTTEDDMMSLMDIVLLQKYLLNCAEFSKTQYISGDMNMDGRVNVIDLALLKKELL